MGAPAGAGRRRGVLLLALAVAVPACGARQARTVEVALGRPPGPGVRVDLNLHHYPVEGATPEEVGTSMERNAPRDEGSTAYGLTRWKLDWSYRLARDGVSCVVRRTRVSVRLDVTLPRWRVPPDVREETLERWHRFERALQRHERQHQRYAVQAAEEIVDALARRRATSCGELDRMAHDEGARIVGKYRDLNREFDLRTHGGGNEGVRWP